MDLKSEHGNFSRYKLIQVHNRHPTRHTQDN